jgi:hypothetical protein
MYQKFKISQAKIIKYIEVNYFWLTDFKFLTGFKLKFGEKLDIRFYTSQKIDKPKSLN